MVNPDDASLAHFRPRVIFHSLLSFGRPFGLKVGFYGLSFCILFVSACVKAQTNDPGLKPQPIYEQCPKLNAGTAADDPVAKAIASLKDKDPKVRAQSALQLSK